MHYQPLGVVGIVVPWSFPFFLALSPLIGTLAAVNSAMLKASEFAPASGKLMQKMLVSIYIEDEVRVVTGGVEVATAFTQLPFDHLVFTGSTPIGKLVMRAAAENLTPVTLELGGKSPAIIHEDFPVEEAAKRLAFGKGSTRARSASQRTTDGRVSVDAGRYVYIGSGGTVSAYRWPSAWWTRC